MHWHDQCRIYDWPCLGCSSGRTDDFVVGLGMWHTLSCFASDQLTCSSQRLIFWIQAPAALVLGPLLFLAIPASSGGRAPLDTRSLSRSLARVDYAGAVALVNQLNFAILYFVLIYHSRVPSSCSFQAWPHPRFFYGLFRSRPYALLCSSSLRLGGPPSRSFRSTSYDQGAS